MRKFHEFGKNEKGAVAVALALMMIPILGLVSMSLDYSNAMSNRTHLQGMVDAAVLAGATSATNDSDDKRKSKALEWFDALSKERALEGVTRTVTVTNGVLDIIAKHNVKSAFNFMMPDTMAIEVKATALISQAPMRRVLDVAMCIDATGSMQGTIDSVKARAQSFYADLNKAIKDRGLSEFDYIRIRAIYYRDFAVDGPPGIWGSMMTSDFFKMPAEKVAFETFIASVNAFGGGDWPESSHECVNESLRSSWFKIGENIPGSPHKAEEVYNLIIIWSDAPTTPISAYHATIKPYYPANMPRTEVDFRNNWNNPALISQTNRLLVHFGYCSLAVDFWGVKESWNLIASLPGYSCGGSIGDGNTNMINKIADAIKDKFKNKLTRLSK